MWTIVGDTLSHKTALCPEHYEVVDNYMVFTFDRPLPINSVIRSVELWIKK